MFHQTQNKDYLDLMIHRALHEDLDWVEQYLDRLQDFYGEELKFKRIHDLGCAVGLFWKGIKRRNWSLNYFGYDIEPIYLQEAQSLFPELSGRLYVLDIDKQCPSVVADITVVSGMLEHISEYTLALQNILNSTREMLLLRTFLGNVTQKAIYQKKDAQFPYVINQYSFKEILSTCQAQGFKVIILTDQHTQSLPVTLSEDIVRTFYVIEATKIKDAVVKVK